jgi:hypothetical protein
MPRRSRLDLPSTIHHISIRGVDRMRIFRDEEDAADMLARFDRWTCETGSDCLGWSFNGNHGHWVIARHDRSLAEVIARFASAYAQHFNRRHNRTGPLFDGRYRSRVIRGDDDLRWTTVYALANPVRHGVDGLGTIDENVWAGWGAVIGRRTPYDFERIDAVLRLFGESDSRARENLRRELARAVETRWQLPWEARLEQLIDETCAAHGVARDEFTSGSVDSLAAQGAVVCKAIRDLGLPWRLVEERLRVPRSRISRALKAG